MVMKLGFVARGHTQLCWDCRDLCGLRSELGITEFCWWFCTRENRRVSHSSRKTSSLLVLYCPLVSLEVVAQAAQVEVPSGQDWRMQHSSSRRSIRGPNYSSADVLAAMEDHGVCDQEGSLARDSFREAE